MDSLENWKRGGALISLSVVFLFSCETLDERVEEKDFKTSPDAEIVGGNLTTTTSTLPPTTLPPMPPTLPPTTLPPPPVVNNCRATVPPVVPGGPQLDLTLTAGNTIVEVTPTRSYNLAIFFFPPRPLDEFCITDYELSGGVCRLVTASRCITNPGSHNDLIATWRFYHLSSSTNASVSFYSL